MFLVEDLIDSIKIRSMIPFSSNTVDDDVRLLSLINEELSLNLVSDLISIREDFFLKEVKINLKNGLNRYQIPDDCIGNSVKQMFVVDQNGSISPVERVDVSYLRNSSPPGTPEKCYFKGNEIIFVPTPNSDNLKLFISYPARPNILTLSKNTTKITGYNIVLDEITLNVDTDLTQTILVNSYIDITSSKSPFLKLADKALVKSISSTQIVIDLSNVQNEILETVIQIGDYISMHGYSNVPQIPVEFHPVLAQMVVVQLLQAFGDNNKTQVAIAILNEKKSEAMKLVKTRYENSPKTITPSGLQGVF